MDATDIRLCQLLLQDSRTPYRDLAEKVNITVQAVYKRIQVMQEMKIVSNFHASITVGYLNAVNTVMVGKSGSLSRDETAKALSKDDRIHRAMPLAGNLLLVESVLRDISELEPHMEFVKKAGQMSTMMMGIMGTTQFGNVPINQRPEERFEFTPLDYAIIASLQTDSRKAVVDIAGELKVSAKTVKRRLDRMVAEKVIEFSMTYHPGFAGGAAAVVILDLKSGSDKSTVRRGVLELIGPKLIYMTTFVNLPDTVLAVVYCGTMMECNDMMERVAKIEGVDKYTQHIVQFGYEFETWRDRMPKEFQREKVTRHGGTILTTGKY